MKQENQKNYVNVLYLQSGGPTSVINASMKGVIDGFKDNSSGNLYFSLYGVEGLINDNIISLDSLDKPKIRKLEKTPGTFLGSARHRLKPFLEDDHEYLKKVTIGIPKKHNATIYLSEYDPNWPLVYKQLSKEIQSVLQEKVILIEHVGSTSVPGLCAKPIIDILLEVENSADENQYVSKLESIGYVLKIRELDWYQHRCFKHFDPEVNLHVFSKDCKESKRMIWFRNHLRNNEADRTLYANTKRELALRKWEYIQDYADAKSRVVSNIMSHMEVLS